MAVRSLLARVARLEQARASASPFVLAYGSLEAWEADWLAGIDHGRFDPRDIPTVLNAVQRWHKDGVFGG